MEMAQSSIARALDFLADDPDLLLVMIFGSMADGNPKIGSDIDVAVYPKKKLSSQQRQKLSDQIACATGRTVDLVDLTDADGALLRQILRKGRIVFSKQAGVLGHLSERLLGWQEDFEPQLNAMLETRLQRFITPAHGA
jgi:predicted nucleotidyltransferase